MENSRRKDDSLEQMLREMSATMQTEVGRAAKLQEEHDRQLQQAKAGQTLLEGELKKAKKAAAEAKKNVVAAPSSASKALSSRWRRRWIACRMACDRSCAWRLCWQCMATSIRGTPSLLPALIQLDQLIQHKDSLEAEAKALRVAQADAVQEARGRSAGGWQLERRFTLVLE